MARLHSLQRVLRSAGVTGDVQVDPGSDMKDMRYIGPGRQFVAGEAISVNAALVLSTFTPGSPLLTMVNADSNAAGKVEVWGFATTAVASGAVGTCVEWLIVTDLDTSLYTKDANVYLKSDASGSYQQTPTGIGEVVTLGKVLKAHASQGAILLDRRYSTLPNISGIGQVTVFSVDTEAADKRNIQFQLKDAWGNLIGGTFPKIMVSVSSTQWEDDKPISGCTLDLKSVAPRGTKHGNGGMLEIDGAPVVISNTRGVYSFGTGASTGYLDIEISDTAVATRYVHVRPFEGLIIPPVAQAVIFA